MGDQPVTKQDLASFKDFVVSQLALHKSVISFEVQKSQEAASSALSASNSLKEQSEVKFNHIDNERSFKFNGQVLAKLVSLKDQLADLPPNSGAFSILDETIKILQERNRKIRIAGSSEAGWLTVKHYESNPVSLSEDDDKKIRAAERQALRDQARQRKKRNGEGFALRNQLIVKLNLSSPLTQGSSTGASVLGNSRSRSLPLRHQHFSTTNREFTRGLCRYCSSSGHWWKECPVRLARFHIGCSSSQLPASSTGTVNRP